MYVSIARARAKINDCMHIILYSEARAEQMIQVI